ncbi:MAG: hypothetical protein AAB417_01530 [Patescibacteria group bacterium]
MKFFPVPEEHLQKIADKAIADALEFMEAREQEAKRAHLLPLLCLEVATLIYRSLATKDTLVESPNPAATRYFRLGFNFKLLCTSLGYERIQEELERAALILEQKFIASISARIAA